MLIKLRSIFVIGAALVAAHSTAFAACPATPYTVQLKEAAGKISVSVPPALAALKPDIGGGGEYSRRMIGAMGPSVVVEMLANYECKVKEAVDADPTKSAAERAALMEAWGNASTDIAQSATTYFISYSESAALGLAANPYPIKQSIEAEMKGLSAYIQGLPKTDNFLVEDSANLWLNAAVGGVSANACGKYLKAALATNAPMIQHLAAAIRPMLSKYFNPTSQFGPRNAKVDLWAQAASSRLAAVPAGAELASAFKECGSK